MRINKKYPGKQAGEIYEKVDALMEHIAAKLSLSYQKDGKNLTGKVSKMGITGDYTVQDEQVTIELKFPILVPGSMKQKVTEDIERKLDGLFS